MSIAGEPEPFLRVTVGSPVFTYDERKVGVVKEIRGRAFKVDAGFWRAFWLGAEQVSRAVPGQSVSLGFRRADLSGHKLREPRVA